MSKLTKVIDENPADAQWCHWKEFAVSTPACADAEAPSARGRNGNFMAASVEVRRNKYVGEPGGVSLHVYSRQKGDVTPASVNLTPYDAKVIFEEAVKAAEEAQGEAFLALKVGERVWVERHGLAGYGTVAGERKNARILVALDQENVISTEFAEDIWTPALMGSAWNDPREV
jgi:hypothetical protein